MKIIKNINTLAILLPLIILASYPIVKEDAIYLSLYSAMFTGFLQVALGIILLIENPRNWYFINYILIVILFFGLWYFNMNLYHSDILTYILFPIPLLLTIYLSVLIYKRKEI